MNADDLKARTRQFAIDVLRLCRQLAADDVVRNIKRQLIRSGSSVAANYRSACRGRSGREFVAKLGIAVEEIDESELWLDCMEALDLKPADRIAELRREARELLAILSKSHKTARENLKRKEEEKRNRKCQEPRISKSSNLQISK